MRADRLMRLRFLLAIALVQGWLAAAEPQAGARIVNGYNVIEGSYPTVARIDQYTNFVGTGTLISSKHILTAAHVAYDSANTYVMPPEAFVVYLGGLTRQVVNVTVHPTYTPSGLGVEGIYDLCILELLYPVDGVVPTPASNSPPANGTTVTIVGFGLQGGGAFPPPGQIGVGTNNLSAVTQTFLDYVIETGEADSTPGDSGGPVFIDVNGTRTIFAVCSYGTGTPGEVGSRTGNTRVDIALPWINSIIGSGGGTPAAGIDVAVTLLETNAPIGGDPLRFSVSLYNAGDAIAGTFNVGFYRNRDTAPAPGDPPDSVIQVASLPPSQVASLAFFIPADAPGKFGKAWVLADVSNAIADINRDNNVRSLEWTRPAASGIQIVSGLRVSNNPATPGDTISFTIIAASGSGLLYYQWDFGDGVNEAGGATILHTFASEGTYTVKVAMEDGQGTTVISQLDLLVTDSAVVNLGSYNITEKKGRLNIPVPMPEFIKKSDRPKARLVDGELGSKVKFAGNRIRGKNLIIGEYAFAVQYSMKKTGVIRTARYVYTLVP